MVHDRGPEEKVMTISALRSDTITWDPGGKGGTGGRQVITIENVGMNENDAMYKDSRMELDSRANMAVIGWYTHILSNSDRTVEVNAFTLEHATIKAPLIDAALQYDSPYDSKSYILVIRNWIHITSMANNLIQPFLMREVGVAVGT